MGNTSLNPNPEAKFDIEERAGAAVRYRLAVGPLAGQRTMTLRVPARPEPLPSTPGPLTANHEGFSLNAAVACGARERDKLEQFCWFH